MGTGRKFARETKMAAIKFSVADGTRWGRTHRPRCPVDEPADGPEVTGMEVRVVVETKAMN